MTNETNADLFKKTCQIIESEGRLKAAELPRRKDWLDNRVTWTVPDGSLQVSGKVDIVAVGGDEGGDEMGYINGKPVLRYGCGDWLDASDGTPFVDGDGTHYLVRKQTWMQENDW